MKYFHIQIVLKEIDLTCRSKTQNLTYHHLSQTIIENKEGKKYL